MSEKNRLLQEMDKSLEDLFSDIPPEARTDISKMGLPCGKDEAHIHRLFQEKSQMNSPSTGSASFLGGDIQSRYIPAALQYIMSRGELMTAYTSYQPEISQGMLQALFEYQSLMAELTKMSVVNSSLYDGATALGEALCLSSRANKKKEFLLPRVLCPSKKNVSKVYTEGIGGKLKFYDYDMNTGGIDVDSLLSLISPDTSAVYVEMPNALGVLDASVTSLKESLGKVSLVVGVDPISLGVLQPPGDYGADIVVGEGQALGLPMGFGGPGLGIFGVRREFVRKMPGRLVGVTHDEQGESRFCITLQAREQHIRRERATSNICTNEALYALGAAAYLSLIGGTGLKRLADLLVERSHKLADEIDGIAGFAAPAFSLPFFSSFAVKCPMKYKEISDILLTEGIHGGYSLSQFIPLKENMALFSVNETIPMEAYSNLTNALKQFSTGNKGEGA